MFTKTFPNMRVPVGTMTNGVNIATYLNRRPVIGEYTFVICMKKYFTLLQVTDLNPTQAAFKSIYEVELSGGVTIDDLIYMQDVDFCDFDTLAASMELEKVYTLIDKRDGTPYTLTLAKDGNIWMTKNLRIADYLCTPEDTDITEGTYQIPASDIKSIIPSNDGAGVYIDETYGGYYNYRAATAGEVGIMDSIDATQSILPKGWKLANQNEWLGLINAYGGDLGGAAEKLIAPPLSFTLSGSVGNGLLGHTAELGRFTGATHDPTTIQKFYGLYLRTSDNRVIVTWGHHKADGIAVRGIVRRKEE